jgi:L-seryl-tRNA(Ser) seleniumtransferase
MPPERAEAEATFRLLPSVEEVLSQVAPSTLAPGPARDRLLDFVRETIDRWRSDIRSGHLLAGDLRKRLSSGDLVREVQDLIAVDSRRGLKRAINATGVVLHTGLGRAPVHPEVAQAMAEAASSYCILEVDRETGERNERDAHLGTLLTRLTGAEAGIAVNNNAAAVFLTLQTWGAGKETIVSRGELVEIGGSFRMPDVMARAGTTLREVGTTNRTRLEDYRQAITPRTGLLLKVHTSNYRLQGFVHEVSADELSALGSERGLPTSYDLGSGLIELPGATPLTMLGDEPRVRDAVSSGIDVVTFSGDKLLGGPQAGLIVGKRSSISALRKNPIYRAMRLDKVTLAGLEKTVELYLAGRADELPSRQMLLASAESLRPVAERIAAQIRTLDGFTAAVMSDKSQPGSGSAPGIFLDTFVVQVKHSRRSAFALAHALRLGDPPVFARIQEALLLLDMRTILPGEVHDLTEGIARIDA